jgi:hypothetical protein
VDAGKRAQVDLVDAILEAFDAIDTIAGGEDEP